MCAKLLQSYPTLCDSVNCSLPGSLSMEFSMEEYWSGLPCPPAGTLPNPGIEPMSFLSPALAGRFFTRFFTWEAQRVCSFHQPILLA